MRYMLGEQAGLDNLWAVRETITHAGTINVVGAVDRDALHF